MPGTLGEAVVEGHHRLDGAIGGEPYSGRKVNGIERADQGGGKRLGGGKQGLVHRNERDGAEDLVRLVEHTMTTREAPKLDPEQATGDVVVEVRERRQHGGGIRLAEQHPTEGARVEVDASHRSGSVARSPCLREELVGRARRSARRCEPRSYLVKPTQGHARSEPSREARVLPGVRARRHEHGHLLTALGHDQALP